MFRDEQPTCAVFLADGRSVYGTTRSGLVVFDRDGKYDRRIDRRQGLPGNRVNGLCVDREGGVWLATPVGIVRVQLDSPFAAHGEAQGLTGGPRQLTRAGDRIYVTHGEGFAWRADSDGQFFSSNGFRTGSHHVIPQGGGVLVAAQGLHEITRAGEDRALAGPYFTASPGCAVRPVACSPRPRWRCVFSVAARAVAGNRTANSRRCPPAWTTFSSATMASCGSPRARAKSGALISATG